MNIFQSGSFRKPRSNVFDMSVEKKFSMNMGSLIPFYCQDIVPGDKFSVSSEMLMRLAPMVSPVMHRINVYTHFFFVPNRIIFQDWEPFITGGTTGTSEPNFPTMLMNNANRALFVKGRVGDYLGLPVMPGLVEMPDPITKSVPVSMLPFRAYQRIYYDYFQDQTLTDFAPPSTLGTVVGGEPDYLTTIRKRAWEKDYFTSALPWTQRGPDTSVPLSSSNQATSVRQANTGAPAADGPLGVLDGILTDDDSVESYFDNANNLNMNVNDLRRSLKLQEWLEKNARGGARYIEQILHHFGVSSSDARLQRSEYLGGGKSPVIISEVLSTVENTAAELPQGNMAGHGISVGNTNSFSKRFEEHGYVIGIVSVLPRTAYQQGIERHFSKFDKFDYYFPEFANLGEQAVLSKEIGIDWLDVGDTQPDELFGYQSMYAEYKFRQSGVAGDFRDNLSHWTMGRIFDQPPGLNASFIEADPTHRIFAVENNNVDKLYVQTYTKAKAIRLMPIYGTPML